MLVGEWGLFILDMIGGGALGVGLIVAIWRGRARSCHLWDIPARKGWSQRPIACQLVMFLFVCSFLGDFDFEFEENVL
jgi:hypothetical protein